MIGTRETAHPLFGGGGHENGALRLERPASDINGPCAYEVVCGRTMISTRRFCARPCGVSFDAIGEVSPIPPT